MGSSAQAVQLKCLDPNHCCCSSVRTNFVVLQHPVSPIDTYAKKLSNFLQDFHQSRFPDYLTIQNSIKGHSCDVTILRILPASIIQGSFQLYRSQLCAKDASNKPSTVSGHDDDICNCISRSKLLIGRVAQAFPPGMNNFQTTQQKVSHLWPRNISKKYQRFLMALDLPVKLGAS